MSRRWMLFVDGENLTLRAQRIAESRKLDHRLAPGDRYMKDTFLWFVISPRSAWVPADWGLQPTWATRAHYYTSVVGDEPKILEVREALRTLGFHPAVFKKERKDEKAKGVDIALTKDMLSHAFLNNYDAAVLIAGDGDYVPLVQEVQRLGKQVFLAFFPGDWLNKELRLTADGFFPLTEFWETTWRITGR